MLRFLLALGVVATISAPLQAQRGRGSLGPGDRVRIASDEVSGEFSVVDVRPGVVLVLRADSVSEELNVPMASLSKLEVSLGRRSSSAGGSQGFLIGVGIGAGLGAVLGAGTKDASGLLAAFFGLIGGAVGALRGVGSPGESWEEIPLTQRASRPS